MLKAWISQVFTAILSSLIICTPVFAMSNDEVNGQKDFIKGLADVGVIFNRTGETLNIVIDEQKALEALPILETRGIVTTSDSSASRLAPFSVSIVIIGVSSTMDILQNAFINRSVNKLQVNGFVIPMGEKEQKPCYSFALDRTSFNDLNFNILTPRDFIRDTSSFAFSPFCKSTFDEEAGKLLGANNPKPVQQ